MFAAIPAVSPAGGTIKIDETHSVNVGMGVRSSFNMVENGARVWDLLRRAALGAAPLALRKL